MFLRVLTAGGLVLAGLNAGVLALPAQAAPAAAGIDPQGNRDLCDRLALALTPTSMIPAQTDSLLVNMRQEMLGPQSPLKQMEAQFPGLVDAILTTMRPIIMRSAERLMPGYRDDVAAMYCANLTRAELNEAVAFMTSPDGQLLVTSVNQRMEFGNSVDSLVADKDPTLADINADKKRAATAAIADLSQGQQQRIAAFGTSPTGRKLAALGQKRSAIDQKWFTASDPVAEAEMTAAVQKAIVDHIAKSDPKLAAEIKASMEKDRGAPKR